MVKGPCRLFLDLTSVITFLSQEAVGTEKVGHNASKFKLRWPEPMYMRVGYVFESRFSAGTI